MNAEISLKSIEFSKTPGKHKVIKVRKEKTAHGIAFHISQVF